MESQAATAATTAPPSLRVDYAAADDPARLLAGEGVLAVFGFGDAAASLDDPRYLRVPLQPLGPHRYEVWTCHGPVESGRDGNVAWALCDGLLFGAIEVDEPALPGGDTDIAAAAREAYACLSGFLARSGHPHLLRTWNYFDAITRGEGDDERYRRFCVGRVQGLGRVEGGAMPAATAIGTPAGPRRLQVYWLASRLPGTPVGNPRQLDPWRYPRQYGPQPPSFARAMLPPAGADMPLLLSGTAAIVGHASRHAGDPLAQLDELLANLDSLLARARALRPSLPERFGPGARLKVYVRDRADLPGLAAALDARLGDLPRLLLHGEVCRRELAVEIDGTHA